jgi:WD40 repeat protein
MIRLWDAATGELKSTLKDHSGNVMGLAMSPNGQFFVSGSLDRTARVWRAASDTDVGREEDGRPAR